jgi:hypothetical protein
VTEEVGIGTFEGFDEEYDGWTEGESGTAEEEGVELLVGSFDVFSKVGAELVKRLD